MSALFALSLAFSLLLRIGLIDWKIRRIHNKDVFFLAASTMLHFAFSHTTDLKTMLTTFAIATAMTLPGFIKGLVGGGDIKLLLALSPLWTPYELISVFSSGVLLILLVLRLDTKQHSVETTLPLGTAMSVGTGFWLFFRVFQHG